MWIEGNGYKKLSDNNVCIQLGQNLTKKKPHEKETKANRFASYQILL